MKHQKKVLVRIHYLIIWKYDLNKTKNGPVEVEIKYKKGYQPPKPQTKKTLKDHVAAEKKTVKKKGS